MGSNCYGLILSHLTRKSATKKHVIMRTSAFIVFSFVFVLQIFLSSESFAQVPVMDFSYSYINVTRNNGGGTLETGDIIEMHALINLKNGSTISNAYFISTIPSGTNYVPNTMKMITNEGVVIKSYTDVSGSDVGVYDPAVPGVRINVSGSPNNAGVANSGAGFYSTSGGGGVVGGDVPKGGGGTMAILSFRLVVTAAFGTIINPTATFYYSYVTGSGSNKVTHNLSHDFSYSGIRIIQNEGLCANFSSASFTAESSFGTGNTQNRPAGVNAPGYTKVNLGANAPGDNYYSVANNTSATGATNNGVPYAPTSSPTRVFGGYWDIIGDHTGAVNPSAGNLPVSPGTNGGYMLVVNAAVPTGEVYKDVIQNLCPNTYYEFSAWIRNICGKCGQDKNGAQTYQPGVKPNLTYAVNDIDYYSTGDIVYDGTWVKRGFIYKTGPAETSFSLTIKNNASGGGGNDWVLDDINLATCYPNLIMNPNDTASACVGYPITITDTVRSYYNNYGNYQWEASADGNTWFPIKVSGTGQIILATDPQSITPVLINGLYEYHVNAILAPTMAYNGYYFRLKVATTQSNLTNSNCSVDKSQKVYLKVYNSSCSVLNTEIINFSGLVNNYKNLLQWTVGDEQNLNEYVIEKSSDGVNFFEAGRVSKVNSIKGNYSFTDPVNSSSINYYRLKLVSDNSTPVGYSKTILLYNRSSSAFKISSVNPFRDNVKVEVFLPAQGKVEVNLFDMYGKSLSKKTLQLSKGNSQVYLDNVSGLPAGMYILTAWYNGILIQNKLVKNN